jgi:hypothetical protein
VTPYNLTDCHIVLEERDASIFRVEELLGYDIQQKINYIHHRYNLKSLIFYVLYREIKS